MGKVKQHLLEMNEAFEKIDMNFEKSSDDYLINIAYDPAALAHLDRNDTLNLVEELARRYQNLLMINAALDGQNN